MCVHGCEGGHAANDVPAGAIDATCAGEPPHPRAPPSAGTPHLYHAGIAVRAGEAKLYLSFDQGLVLLADCLSPC